MANYYAVCVKPSCLWTEETLIDKRIDAHFYSIKYMQYYNKLMKCKIKKMSLYNICSRMNSGPFGSALLASQYVDKGVAFIRPLNCKDYIVDIDNDVVFISKEDSERLKSSKFSSGDLIFTKIGNGIGDVAIIPQKMFECNISGNLMGVKVKNNIDNYYVLTFLKSIYGQNQIWQGMMNSAKPKIDMDTLKSIVIPIPSPEIQKYIGDKIRKAEELREEAKRLKKEAEEILNAELKLSYFNERVKDAPKIYNWIYGESIEIRIDSQYYINETNFINNEMYKKGLKLKRISEIANVGKGFSYTSLDNKSIPYIRISDLDDLLINFDTAELVDEKTYSEKKSSQLEKYDLIFAITGATIGKVSLFYNSKYSKSTLSSDTAFVRLKDKNDAAYVLLYLKSFIGQLGILKGVTGATNRHLSLEHIGDIFIPVIDNKLKQEINMRVIKAIDNVYLSKQLIKEAKQDVEDLIEGNFDMSKVKANS